MTHNVVVPDNVNEAALEMLQAADGITVSASGKLNREETLAALPEAEGLIVRSSTKADAELLDAAPQLKVVVRAGVGVDNVDLAGATARGIVVMNTPGGNTISTAEHAFALMLALARHIPAAHQSLKEGRWDRKLYQGVELNGKVLGIVGMGRIGQAIASRARAFGMGVVAYEPYAPVEGIGAQYTDLDGLFAVADFITLHPPLTDETRGMINAQSIARMKPGVRIINAARGGLIVDADLAGALKSGHVAGAALDVYAQEPPSPDNPLIGLPNVIHTPHLAASTSDAQVAVAEEAAQRMIDALLKGEYQSVVNPAVLDKLSQ